MSKAEELGNINELDRINKTSRSNVINWVKNENKLNKRLRTQPKIGQIFRPRYPYIWCYYIFF